MKKTALRPVFAMGGNVSAKGLRLRKKMFAGGNPDQNTSGSDPVDDGLTPGKGTGLNSYNWAVNPSDVTGQSDPVIGKPGSSFLQGASRISTALAPYMSNITNAFRTPGQVPTPNLVAPVTLSKIRLDATRQQATNISRAQDINADRTLDEQSAAAVRSSNLAKNLNQQGQISEQESFLNARQKAEAAGMNLNVDMANTNALNKAQEETVARTNAIQRTQSENVSNATDKYISMGNEQQKARLDLKKLQTLSQIWKDSGVYDRMIKKMKDSGNTDPTGIHGQLGWLGDAMEDANGTDKKAAGGALINPLVGKKPVRPALLSKPMTGPNKNGFKQVFAGGGPGPLATPGLVQTNGPIQGQTDANVQMSNFDRLQYVIGQGGNPMANDYGRIIAKQQDPLMGKVLSSAAIFNQRPEVAGMNPQQRVQAYMTAPSQDPDVKAYLTKMNIWSKGSNLNQSPDAGVQAMQQPGFAAKAFGGYRTTMGKGYLNPFGNTRSIGLGPGIKRDKFNPYHVGHQQNNLLAGGGSIKFDGARPDITRNWTNYGDATPDLYEYGGIGGGYRMGGPFQEEWKMGGNISRPRLKDHSMWKQPYKENALTNNDPNFGTPMAMGGEFSGEATARDMSMWNRKVWKDKPDPGTDLYGTGGPVFNDDYFADRAINNIFAANGGPLVDDTYFNGQPTQIFAAAGGPLVNDNYMAGDEPTAVYKNGGIHIKPSHKGRFTAYKARTGKTTAQALQSSDPHVRKMAQFAKNAAGWKHAMGGRLKPCF